MDINKRMHLLITGLFPGLHYLLVKRDPYLLNAFDSWTALHPLLHEKWKIVSYLVVLKINIQFLFHKLLFSWKPCLAHAESVSDLPSPESLVSDLEEADVISFDIFDTLLLRPFASPQTVFTLVGEKLGIPGFSVFRQKAQEDLMAESDRTDREYSLEDIYRLLAEQLGISAETGMELERQAELACSSANPYMLQVFQMLKKNGKTLIAVSDMYLCSRDIQTMLEKNGFSGFDRLFISRECGCTKRGTGNLYKLVQEKYPRAKIVHIGDDAVVDVASAQRHGFRTFHFRNVQTLGNPYRVSGLTPILNSAYSGVVNMHLHNGLHTFSPAYEYGFVYGGLLISGFCRRICDYANHVQADRIWFMARDGLILQKVFQKLYPEIKTGYFLWSRTAALKAAAQFDKSAWKKFFLFDKASSPESYTVQEIMQDAGIGELASAFSHSDRILTSAVLPELEAFLDSRWERILQIYEKDRIPLRNYIQTMRGKSEKIILVDIGYSGTCPLALQRILKEEAPSVRTHILMGIYGRVKLQPDLLLSPEIHPYLFSENYNVDLWRDYSGDSNGTNSLRLEMFFSAPHAYVNGFSMTDHAKYRIEWGHHHKRNDNIVREIHQGILDFAVRFHETFKKYPWLLKISGRDAYLPFAAIKKQNAYFKKFFADFIFDSMPKNRKAVK